MKKLLLLLLSIILFSCSAEDEPSNEIVGSWQYQGMTEFTEDGEAIERSPAPCAQNSTLKFSNNGNLKEVDYIQDGQGGCMINTYATKDDLSWEEVSKGTYRVFSDRSTGVVYEISFPDKNTMWMSPEGSYERNGVSYRSRAYIYKKI